ncbi:hypothetical protein ACFRFJ_15920 [Streptomyces hydrogenans]|uniref:hypothetical protein n=1 Tax=Streptomyces hydrogenans TaxID=1873719 RepID=UPI00369468EB
MTFKDEASLWESAKPVIDWKRHVVLLVVGAAAIASVFGLLSEGRPAAPYVVGSGAAGLLLGGLVAWRAVGRPAPDPLEGYRRLVAQYMELQAEHRMVREKCDELVCARASLEGGELSPDQTDELRALRVRYAVLTQKMRLAQDTLAAIHISLQGRRPQSSALGKRVRGWRKALASVKLSSGLTSLALALAGRRREESQVQWRDQLEGAPEDGIIVTPAMRVRYSLGFVVAALHYRLSDIVAPGWRMVDWLLATHSRTNSFVALAVGGQAIYITWAHGLDILLTEGSAWLLATGAGIVGVAVWLRKNRGIEPPDARQPAE